MTKIKLCGLSRPCDIHTANELLPEYIGFVFWGKSKRYISPDQAEELKKTLSPSIKAVGVFVNESPEKIAELISRGIIDMAQLHGGEDNDYIKRLRQLTDAEIIKAFRVRTQADIEEAEKCAADHILLDSGMGSGNTFEWEFLRGIERPYFLAGGLDQRNAAEAVKTLHPFALDVSSGIETDGKKDAAKMTAFVKAVRNRS